MEELILFTDGSVDPKTKSGFGAYLAIDQSDLGDSFASLSSNIRIKRFEQTSSTKLELQTLLWALREVGRIERKLVIYTDSQNIISLANRRYGLEESNYLSKNNKPLKNSELYKEFYSQIDEYDCKLMKVKGHSPKSDKSEVDRLFSLVDKATRMALRSAKS